MFWKKKKSTYEYICAKGHVWDMAYLPNSKHPENMFCIQCKVEAIEKWMQENVTPVTMRIKEKVNDN